MLRERTTEEQFISIVAKIIKGEMLDNTEANLVKSVYFPQLNPN